MRDFQINGSNKVKLAKQYFPALYKKNPKYFSGQGPTKISLPKLTMRIKRAQLAESAMAWIRSHVASKDVTVAEAIDQYASSQGPIFSSSLIKPPDGQAKWDNVPVETKVEFLREIVDERCDDLGIPFIVRKKRAFQKRHDTTLA